MGNGDQILDQLLLWTELFRVHDQQLATSGCDKDEPTGGSRSGQVGLDALAPPAPPVHPEWHRC